MTKDTELGTSQKVVESERDKLLADRRRRGIVELTSIGFIHIPEALSYPILSHDSFLSSSSVRHPNWLVIFMMSIARKCILSQPALQTPCAMSFRKEILLALNSFAIDYSFVSCHPQLVLREAGRMSSRPVSAPADP